MYTSRGTAILTLIIVVIVGFSVMGWLYWGSLNPAVVPEEPALPSGGVGLANPAAVYCVEEQKGQTMVHDVYGGQAGYCILPDGRECEEWVLFETKGENCVKFVAAQSFADQASCRDACVAADYNTGECMKSQEVATGYHNAGPCLINGSAKCGQDQACHCFCHQ